MVLARSRVYSLYNLLPYYGDDHGRGQFLAQFAWSSRKLAEGSGARSLLTARAAAGRCVCAAAAMATSHVEEAMCLRGPNERGLGGKTELARGDISRSQRTVSNHPRFVNYGARFLKQVRRT